MFCRLTRRFRRKKVKATPPFRPTYDSRTEKHLNSLLPGAQETFRDLTAIAKKTAGRYGLDAKVISGHRTYQEQAALYSKGRDAPGKKVTNARPGYSNHNFGIAVDFGLFDDGEYVDAKSGDLVEKIYRVIRNLAESDGLKIEWGGDWKSFPDPPHFQFITPWSMAEMRERKGRDLPIV